MASRRLCISAGHACDARPVRPRAGGAGGGGGRPHRRALGGFGGLGAPVGGAAPTCPIRGGGLRTPCGYPRGGPHARQQRVEGMASTFVHSAQGGGTFSTHVHASTGWKYWASTPVDSRQEVAPPSYPPPLTPSPPYPPPYPPYLPPVPTPRTPPGTPPPYRLACGPLNIKTPRGGYGGGYGGDVRGGGRYGGFGSSHTRRCTDRAVHTQGGAHKRRSVATVGVLLFKGPRARRYTRKAVHTKGGTHTRRCTQKAACSHRRSLVF